MPATSGRRGARRATPLVASMRTWKRNGPVEFYATYDGGPAEAGPPVNVLGARDPMSPTAG
jgi:hypothetical protein